MNFLKNIDLTKLQKPSILFIVFCACFSFWFMDLWRVWHFNENQFIYDPANYYSYLPAYFNYNGSFEFNHIGVQEFLGNNPLGGHMPKATYGMAFLYSPWYALGYKVALNTHSPMTGFSEPFATCIRWGSIFYGLLGLLLLRNLLVKFFSERTTTITLAIIFLGTSVFHYVLAQSEMAQAESARQLRVLASSKHSDHRYVHRQSLSHLVARAR